MLRGGMGCAELALPPGLMMDGYGRRTAPSVGTRDPLEVTLLHLTDGGGSVTIVGADLVAVGAPLVARIRTLVQQVLPGSAVMVAASHTHAGPAGVREGARPEALDRALERAVIAAARAAARTRPLTARIGFGALPTEVATDRNDPQRPVDRRTTLVELLGNDGAPVGLVWHAAFHPTVLGPDNLRYSADLPGAVRRRLRRDREPVLFLNGAAGNVSTRFTRRARDEAELDRLGAALHAALARPSNPVRLDPVAVRDGRLSAPPAVFDDDLLAEVRRVTTERLGDAGPGTAEHRRLESVLEGVSRAAGRAGAQPVDLAVQTMRLGDLALVGLPGEPVSELAAALDVGTLRAALLVGYANDYAGYLTGPTDELTYEALAAQVEPGTGRRLLRLAEEQLAQVVG